METIHYKNFRALQNSHCEDCSIRLNRGCRYVDPMDCDVVNKAIRDKQEEGYKITVGRFKIEAL